MPFTNRFSTPTSVTLVGGLAVSACLVQAEPKQNQKEKGQEKTNQAQGDDWEPLIPKEGLAGWHSKPGKTKDLWQNTGGTIVGENPDEAGSTLWTDKAFDNFELILEFKTPSEDYDSGIFLRGKSHQVQIGISRSRDRDLTGSIYAPKDGRGGYPAKFEEVKKVHKPGKWNKLRIVARGQRIRTFLNGEPAVDYKAKTLPEKGPIGLQLHPNIHIKVLFSDIRLRKLDEQGGANTNDSAE